MLWSPAANLDFLSLERETKKKIQSYTVHHHLYRGWACVPKKKWHANRKKCQILTYFRATPCHFFKHNEFQFWDRISTAFIEIRPWKRKKKFKKDERASERWSHFEWWLCECERRMSDDLCNREITKNSRVLKALNHFNFSFALWGASSKLLTQTIADDNL